MSNHRLMVHDLTVSYGRVPAINRINVELTCGHCVGLIGPNGAGKTTLIKAIAGLVKLESGQVLLHDHACSGADGGIAYLPQRGQIDWDFPMTVRGLVEMGRFPSVGHWRSFTAADQMVVEEALQVTKLSALAGRQIHALSGGQQQRAFLARAYTQQAHVYLLDEPLAGLDANAQEDLREILRAMAAEGKLILASHHDLKSVPELFDEVILLNRELIACGSVAAVFTEANLARTFATRHETGGQK